MAYQDFYRLTNDEKKQIFTQVEYNMGLPAFAVEKDWWVVRALDIIFQSELKDHLVFKGGTSLSKAWGLIERFSEDIDLALDRSFLGFEGEIMGKSQITRLRKASNAYIQECFVPQLLAGFENAELGVALTTSKVNSADQDPLIIEVYYPSVTKTTTYIQPRVLVEIGCRSLTEPFSFEAIQSEVGKEFADSDLADTPIQIPSVLPERTFLEKLFLLHEEFQRPAEKIRVERLSRHLYDIYRMGQTEILSEVVKNADLYATIVQHRSVFAKLGGVDYSTHFPPNLRPIPPGDRMEDWKNDYKTMQEQMIYGEPVSFEAIIKSVAKIAERINNAGQ